MVTVGDFKPDARRFTFMTAAAPKGGGGHRSLGRPLASSTCGAAPSEPYSDAVHLEPLPPRLKHAGLVCPVGPPGSTPPTRTGTRTGLRLENLK